MKMTWIKGKCFVKPSPRVSTIDRISYATCLIRAHFHWVVKLTDITVDFGVIQILIYSQKFILNKRKISIFGEKFWRQSDCTSVYSSIFKRWIYLEMMKKEIDPDNKKIRKLSSITLRVIVFPAREEALPHHTALVWQTSIFNIVGAFSIQNFYLRICTN